MATESHEDAPARTTETTPLLPSNAEHYSVFTTSEKRLIILTAALASAFSPLSANIYYPALNSIAKDLHVSPSQINLTITTYMVRRAAIHTPPSIAYIPIDLPRHRTNIHRFLRRPGGPPTRLYLLFRDLHLRQHRACAAALVPRAAGPPRRAKLREQRHCRPRLRRGRRYHHLGGARRLHGPGLVGEYSRAVFGPDCRWAFESVSWLAGDLLVPGCFRYGVLRSFLGFLPGDVSGHCWGWVD